MEQAEIRAPPTIRQPPDVYFHPATAIVNLIAISCNSLAFQRDRSHGIKSRRDGQHAMTIWYNKTVRMSRKNRQNLLKFLHKMTSGTETGISEAQNPKPKTNEESGGNKERTGENGKILPASTVKTVVVFSSKRCAQRTAQACRVFASLPVCRESRFPFVFPIIEVVSHVCFGFRASDFGFSVMSAGG